MTYALLLLAVLLVIDWRQTLVIARNPEKWHEVNPILGEHPSPARVHCWFALCLLLVASGYFAPPVYAVPVAVIWAFAEAACVFNNIELGIS